MNSSPLYKLIAGAIPALAAVVTAHAASLAASVSDVGVAAIATTAQSAVPTADDRYTEAMRQHLQRLEHYPNSREARQLRPQGVATVWLEVDGSGRLLGSGIATSSRSPLLDSRALQTVRTARYAAFGDAATTRRFTVPIEFIPDGAS